jgi:hypothetical protein
MNLKTALSTLILGATLALSSPFVHAGPFNTLILEGTSAQNDFDLVIPKGKAVSLQTFIDHVAGGTRSTATLIVSTLTFKLMNATPADDAANGAFTNKDVTIDGPATIHLIAPLGQRSVLNYRLFAN